VGNALAADVCSSLWDIYERKSKQSDLIRFYRPKQNAHIWISILY